MKNNQEVELTFSLIHTPARIIVIEEEREREY